MIVGVTGHRPNRLGGYGDEAFGIVAQLATEYLCEVQPDRVFSGMAPGWDLAMAFAAMSMGIALTAAVPCDAHESVWPVETQEMYRVAIAGADKVVIVSPGPYEAWKMQTRNRWIVDRIDFLAGLWDGGPGGTANCIQYAVKAQRPWVNLWPRFQEIRK